MDEVEELKKEITELKKENEELKEDNKKLAKQVEDKLEKNPQEK